MKLVHIEWIDAHHHAPGEWIVLGDLDVGMRVTTTGFLLDTKHKHYTIASSVDEDGNVTGVFSIPKACVTRYTVVRSTPTSKQGA